jgi:hypothetical protein
MRAGENSCMRWVVSEITLGSVVTVMRITVTVSNFSIYCACVVEVVRHKSCCCRFRHRVTFRVFGAEA